MTKEHPRNSTNVRFLGPMLAALVAGCASQSSPLVDQRCPAQTLLVCEHFGAERRCECAARSEATMLLPAAWPFGRP